MSESMSIVGPYRVLRRLARGGMAEIFLAKKDGAAGFSKTIVVKRILPEHAGNDEFVQMFRDEALLAALLAHPNIVHIGDFLEVQGSYCLEMEYLQGHDLGSLLRTRIKQGLGPFPVDVTATIAAQACAGLHYAHTFADDDGKPLRIVHRDISPSNIFLTAQGAVKLLDFGIAKAEGKLAQTRVGLVKGKLLYMSPEQTWAKTLDGRSDVWSLGVVLYELLSGERPFFRPSDNEPQVLNERATMTAIDQESPPRLRARIPSIPAELDDIVFRCIEKNPANRFQTASELRKALDDFLRDQRVSGGLLVEFMESTIGVEQLRALTQPTPANRASPVPPPAPLPSSVDLSVIEPLSVSVETRAAPATNPAADPQVGIDTRVQVVEDRQHLDPSQEAQTRIRPPFSVSAGQPGAKGPEPKTRPVWLLLPLGALAAGLSWLLLGENRNTVESPRDAGLHASPAFTDRKRTPAASPSMLQPAVVDAGAEAPTPGTTEPALPAPAISATALSAAFDAGDQSPRPVVTPPKVVTQSMTKATRAPAPQPPPALPPPVAKTTRRLSVRCLPWGDIYVDEVLRASRVEKDVVIETTSGPHAVECRHPDFGKRRTNADVKDKDTLTSVTLDLQ